MKPNRLLLSITVAAIFMASAFITAVPARADTGGDEAGLGLARISYMNGDVLFNTRDEGEWSEATPNFPLVDGDRLWAGDDSKLELRFATGETAWANYQTELDMLKLTRTANGNEYQLGLPFGEASFNVNNFEVLGSVFQVDTPNASIRAYGRALFRVSALADGTTQVGVREGSVEVESERGIANLYPGEMLEIYQDGRSRIVDLPSYDDWDDWVDARLERYNRTYASSKYLPPDMRYYSDEFDEGGRWVSYPEYGYIWVPTVAAGWSPYSNGRWVWTGWDYVWMGYDPWYAPFHYGRWSWTARFGWCWVPPVPTAVYWSPGYVGWVWTAGYVGWVPLAPGEVYFGYGHYGPHSIDIRTTKVIVNNNVYVNSRVKHGVVVVGRDNFLKGRTDRVRDDRVIRDLDTRFGDHKRDRNRPFAAPVADIKPIRDTRIPRPDRTFKADSLPKKVVEHRMFETERRVVKGNVKSAFEPAKEPRHMQNLERLTKPEFRREPARQGGAAIKPTSPEIRTRTAPSQERTFERQRTPSRETPQSKQRLERQQAPVQETPPARQRFERQQAPSQVTPAPGQGFERQRTPTQETPSRNRNIEREKAPVQERTYKSGQGQSQERNTRKSETMSINNSDKGGKRDNAAKGQNGSSEKSGKEGATESGPGEGWFRGGGRDRQDTGRSPWGR
jgi:Family of unknown function (DUF6600)/FecR protein